MLPEVENIPTSILPACIVVVVMEERQSQIGQVLKSRENDTTTVVLPHTLVLL